MYAGACGFCGQVHTVAPDTARQCPVYFGSHCPFEFLKGTPTIKKNQNRKITDQCQQQKVKGQIHSTLQFQSQYLQYINWKKFKHILLYLH